jgi:ATP-binding cassette subfamily A (ABC1) protein 3
MMPPTSGTATVLGMDIKKDMNRVRENVGYCAQHSVLWEELSVAEHLQIFGSLKGLTGKVLDAAVTQAIEEVSLQEKRDRQTKELSGGQGRRLCLANALIGDARVVFLDESVAQAEFPLHSC